MSTNPKVDAYIASVSGSKQAFFNAIVNERAWEFGGECLRKYDLARWNLYGKKIAETKSILTQMGIDGMNGTGTYANLPDYMYYKRDSTDKNLKIVWYNKHTKPAVAPPLMNSPSVGDNPNGYIRIAWTRSMFNTTTNGPADFILRTWRGYKDDSGTESVRYILPLHNSVISSSLGVLQNQYGY